MSETAAQRFARDTGYKSVSGGPNHESGSVRFSRTFLEQDHERTDRRYVNSEHLTNSNLMTVARSFEDASDWSDDDLGNWIDDGYTQDVVASELAPHGGNVLRHVPNPLGVGYLEFPVGDTSRSDLTVVEVDTPHMAHISIMPTVTTSVALGVYTVLDDRTDYGMYGDEVIVECPAGTFTDIALPFTAPAGEKYVVLYVSDTVWATGCEFDIDKVGIWAGSSTEWRS